MKLKDFAECIDDNTMIRIRNIPEVDRYMSLQDVPSAYLNRTVLNLVSTAYGSFEITLLNENVTVEEDYVAQFALMENPMGMLETHIESRKVLALERIAKSLEEK